MAQSIERLWVLENGDVEGTKVIKRRVLTGCSTPILDSDERAPSPDGESVVAPTVGSDQQQDNGESVLDQAPAFQTRTFSRRRESPTKPRRVVCCDRCKSDLNGKLLARCITCGFCRHLYCFSPPLKQHPAWESQPELKKRISASAAQALITRWKCQSCRNGDLEEYCDPGRPNRVDIPRSSLAKKRTRHNKAFAKVLPTQQLQATSSPPKSAPAIQKLEPALSPTCDEQPVEFDWYKFRADKVARVLDRDGSKDELVYYSRSVALMRKTARFWFYYMHQKRMRAHLAKREQQWLSGPKILDIKYILKETDHFKMETSRQRRTTEALNLQQLFTDERIPTRYYRPPRQSQPVLFDIGPDIVGSANKIVADLLSEMVASISVGAEDFDAMYMPGSNDLIESGQGIFGLQLAARVIQRLLRLKRRARRVQRQGSNDDKIVEDAHAISTQPVLEVNKPREQAQTMLSFWALNARFLGMLLAKFKQLQLKKAVAVMLTESTPSLVEICENNDEECSESDVIIQLERERVARSRISNFFVKYVRPRIYRRKIVMSARIKRWWKREIIRRKWLKWSELVILYQIGVRNNSSRRIQRVYRRYRVKVKLQATLEKLAVRRLRLFLRRWMMNRLIRKERERVELYQLAIYLPIAPPTLIKRPDAPTPVILRELGMAAYSAGDFWSAAYLFEKLVKANGNLDTKDVELMVPFAYAHHMTWYSSYDAFNLTRAHELYCSALECVSKLEGNSAIDPEVLQDLAEVMMQMGNASGSLRLFAKLIEHFSQEPSFSSWLLLAAIQMSHRGEWEQSVQYLTYIQDIPPAPYLERDMLVLCAVGYQHCTRPSGDPSRKEAWRAALRLWTAEKKSLGSPRGGNWATAGPSQPAEDRLKWEVTTDLASRALSQGHYLLSCQMYAYALGRFKSTDLYERQSAWWSLGDAYRHLGKLDAYVEAAARSQGAGEEERPDESLVAAWKDHATRSARSFQDDLDTTLLRDKLLQLGAGITG